MANFYSHAIIQPVILDTNKEMNTCYSNVFIAKGTSIIYPVTFVMTEYLIYFSTELISYDFVVV
jgi:hypothetical protein